MSGPRYVSTSRRPEGPRRVRHGIRLRSRDAVTCVTPLARRWMHLIEAGAAPESLAQGLQYAGVGQTVSLAIRSGVAEATVQGSAVQPYKVQLTIPVLSDEQWSQVVGAMAREAIYAAKLLAGELPETIDQLFESLGLEFLPLDAQQIRSECSCRDPDRCKHVLAVGYLVAERLDQDPLLALTILGMPTERVLEGLRQTRRVEALGKAAAHADPLIPETQQEAPPLEACLDEFWRCGPQLEQIEHLPPPHHAPHALLRRLGPSPLGGRFPLVGLLASVYDTIAESAVRLRDQAESISDPADGDNGDETRGL